MPGSNEAIFLVGSTSNPRKPHLIDATFKNGKVTCDCINYKALKVCAHALAGAKFSGKLGDYSAWHNQQSSASKLDAIVSHNLDGAVGSKKTRRTQQRLGSSKPGPPVKSVVTPSGTHASATQETTGNDRKPVVQPDPYTWEVHFLKWCHFKTKTCGVCKKALKYGNAEDFSALDMIAVIRMERTHFDAKEQNEKDGGIGNVYCHLSLDCIRKKMPDFEAK